MKTIQNSIPKPNNWIWKVVLFMKEAKSFSEFIYKLTGIHLKHGEVRFTIKNYLPVKITILQTTVVDVIADDEQKDNSSDGLTDKEKTANKAVENKD